MRLLGLRASAQRNAVALVLPQFDLSVDGLLRLLNARFEEPALKTKRGHCTGFWNS
jgi:hypothetical protein